MPYRLVAVLIAAVSLFGAESTLLEPGKTLDRQFAGGESHEYQLALDQGQYARIDLFQHSINIAVECFGPDGKLRFQQDSLFIGDYEFAELISDLTGTYRFRVIPVEATAPLGRYTVTRVETSPATERHRSRIAAARAFAAGAKLASAHTGSGWMASIPKFEEALGHWRAANDTLEESRTLLVAGLYSSYVGDRSKALDSINRGLTLAQASGHRRMEGWGLTYLAMVYINGSQQDAIDYAERGRILMREVGDREGEATALNLLGRACTQSGDGPKGRAYLNEAMQIFQEVQERDSLAGVATNLGNSYSNDGDYRRSLEFNQQALALYRAVGDTYGEALVLHNLASTYSSIGEFQKTLDLNMGALEINRKQSNRELIAADLHNIGFTYSNLGDQKRALKFYQEALELFRAEGHQRSLAYVLENMAKSFHELGDYGNAVKFHQEALVAAHATNIRAVEATTLNNLGLSYLKLVDRAKALDHFERALALHRSTGEQRLMASTLRNLGTFYREDKDYARAESYSNEALAISRAIHDRRTEARVLADLARLELDRGHFEPAHERAEESLTAFEGLRLTVASPSLRASLFVSAREAEETGIDAMMRLHSSRREDGFDAKALLASERGRARSLLEMLGEAGAEIRRGVDRTLLDRERDLERQLSVKSEQQMRLLSGKPAGNAAASIARELDALSTELEHVQSRIRETSPQYAALIQPVPLDLKEIQSKVTDRDTVLLEYALGTDRSFLWAVTPSSIDSFELPPRTAIEAAAKGVYELLIARNQKIENESAAARAIRIRKADEAFGPAAAKASAMLLGPAATRIVGKRLLIVAEGVLQYLPFASLPDPGDSAVPLIVNHELITAPSASVMAVLRRETEGRKPAAKAVAVLADPVFSAGDARIVSGETHRSTNDLSGQEFVRLRFSRTEAEEIARLAPPGATLKALDFDASRDTVLKPELGQYRILHFATHSVLNNEHPELSGVVLSLVDRAGRPQNGFLRLYDIYNLRLASDLVVLSACQTALGGEIKGEGLIGLTRGFLYAGAPRVVATLWEIDDRTTAELMKQFYEAVLGRGERPAAALRSAQIAIWKNRGWAATYYWAGFTLQGEWR